LAVIHSDAPPVHRPSRRNLGFGVGSVLLLAGTVWMIYYDYHREWKEYQREFRKLEISRAETALDQEEAKLDSSQELANLQQQLQEARASMDERQGDLDAANDALAEAQKKHYMAESDWKEKKSYYDAGKYEFEEARRHIMESDASDDEKAAEVAAEQETFAGYEKDYEEAVRLLDEAKAVRDEAQAKVKALTGAVDELTKKITTMTTQESALQRKIEANETTVTTLIRNAPVIDLAAPTLKIDQVILPHLMADINFMTIPRVDRCVTCHKGIMDASYEGEAEPFTAHPRLDLYLTDSSPHPYTKFGCTICHQGLDRATSFVSAMHTPSDEEQGALWEEEYGWEAPHYWDFPQFPARHTEAACRTCHLHEVRLAGADRYNRSLDLLERAGCFGCHKIEGYEQQRKVGPDLTHVVSKVRPEWAYRWVENPRSYRPNTWMPKFFNLSNSSSPEDRERNAAEIDAIVTYVFDKATPLAPAAATVPAGDPVRGRALVEEKGCLGCHRIGENPTERGTFGRDFGPALDRVGDKVSAEWLYDWVRDPKRYFPTTNMPDLRLTDAEAADVTAYLMSQRKTPPEPPPAVPQATLDAITLEYLKGKLTDDQANQKLASMSEKEKKVYLGEKLIARYGCFGCHNIPGFEQALPIGVELSQEGSKLVTRLDYGFVDIPHTKPAWFLQKLKDPRIFDQGKVKLPQEKLKMPDFGFTDEEASTLVTFILSLQKDVQPLSSHHILDERQAAVERGRRLVQNKNCRGCHIIEGQGGAIREMIPDQAYYPPNLFREGEKVQSDWLYNFVRGPVPIRPWLKVKMPTFGFDEAQATTIARYFAAADEAPFPFQVVSGGSPSPDVMAAGRKTFTDFKCISCHTVGAPPPGVSPADLAPDLTMAATRLRHDWIAKWLRDPQSLMPGTRMPGFFFSDDQPLYPDSEQRLDAVREYVLSLGQQGRRASGVSGN